MESAATSLRVTFDGHDIGNVIQTEKCFECGMGLCDPQEWHPYSACETFKRTHDGQKVWEALRARIAEGDAPWL